MLKGVALTRNVSFFAKSMGKKYKLAIIPSVPKKKLVKKAIEKNHFPEGELARYRQYFVELD
jgi:hypothetical protein